MLMVLTVVVPPNKKHSSDCDAPSKPIDVDDAQIEEPKDDAFGPKAPTEAPPKRNAKTDKKKPAQTQSLHP